MNKSDPNGHRVRRDILGRIQAQNQFTNTALTIANAVLFNQSSASVRQLALTASPSALFHATQLIRQRRSGAVDNADGVFDLLAGGILPAIGRTATKNAIKGPGQRLADRAQGLTSAQRPNTVATIKHKNGVITVGRNRGGFQNAEVQSALDNAPSNCFAGQCAEINALSRALNKGRSLEGAVIDVRNVRGSGSMSGLHGTVKQPCNSCGNVLGQFGVRGP